MPLFSYRAVDTLAATIDGTIAADTARAARDLLRRRGLIVESLRPQADANRSRRTFFHRRQRHAAKRIAMIRELSTLLAAGIPVLESVDSLVQQYTGAFKSSLLTLRDRIASGASLADAMREQPDVFDALSIHMVEVGENSGTSTLDDLVKRKLRVAPDCQACHVV